MKIIEITDYQITPANVSFIYFKETLSYNYVLNNTSYYTIKIASYTSDEYTNFLYILAWLKNYFDIYEKCELGYIYFYCHFVYYIFFFFFHIFILDIMILIYFFFQKYIV